MKRLVLSLALLATGGVTCIAAEANVSADPQGPGPKFAAPKHLFLVGDSTVKNGSGRGEMGLWGWGQVLQALFDADQLRVVNRARGGRSSRTYLTEGLWDAALAEMQAGDYVLIQFGHNDGGKMFKGIRPRASIKGIGEETVEGTVEGTGLEEVVHSYGWYLRRYIADAKGKGVTPIVLSLVPRNRWHEGKIIRSSNDYGKWARESAAMVQAPFIDLNTIVADRYEADGQETVATEYFTASDHTHTSKRGANVNAECVVKGLSQMVGCDLKQCLKSNKKITFAAMDKVSRVHAGTASALNAPGVAITTPFEYSTNVDEGNHLVRVTFGHLTKPSRTHVEAELRRRVLDEVVTQAGEFVVRDFLVNTRTPAIGEDTNSDQVRLKNRELTSEAAAWDEKLSLRFFGPSPSVTAIAVLPAPDVATVYLAGDSTVADQPTSPWASWGQKLPRYFDAQTAVANHSESGETVQGALSAKRFEKIFSRIQSGDWLFVQFGHNDMKLTGGDALDRYRQGIEGVIARTRQLGATPVLVTSMERKAGVHTATLEPYPQTVREIAKQHGVELIDLHAMSQDVYQALGDRLDSAFQDPTHHTDFGAELLASCIVKGIRENVPVLARRLNNAEPVLP